MIEVRAGGRAALVAACAVLAVGVAGCGGSSNKKDQSTNGLGTITLTPQQAQGRTLFQSTCASCHTLGAANAKGKVGPNLDQLRPPAAAVVETVNTGLGAMPARLLKGQNLQDVASFVAAVTAH